MSEEKIRDRLVLALRTHPDLTVLWPSSDRLADALLPVVQTLLAEELRSAADQADEASRRSSSRMFGGDPFPGTVSAKTLRNRADDLDPT